MNSVSISDTRDVLGKRAGIFVRAHSFIILIVLVAFIFSLVACSSSKKAQGAADQQAQPPAPVVQQHSGPQPRQNEKLASLGLTPSRPYAAKAIQIQYRADDNLNIYEEKPHTLMLVIYQLGDVNPFNANIKDTPGLTTLLKGEKFDQSVMAVDKFFIEPGTSSQIELDRYENVKWVGIVAGYYDLTPGQVTRAYELPVQIATKGTFFKTNEAKMGILGMDLYFGPSSIQEVPNP
ncbi:MAG: type VI secretion lipoprotein TssJ [Syntrophorhabdaceae bacterium]